MSTLQVNTIQNTDGQEVYTAKAWVNFNGTGTVAINAAGNVSSITDNGTGDYNVNYTNPMPNTDYTVVAKAGQYGNSNAYAPTGGLATSYVRIVIWDSGVPGVRDNDLVNVIVLK